MKTLKFVLAITIACCASIVCYGSNVAGAMPDGGSPAIVGFHFEIEPALREYVKIEDDLVQLNISLEDALELGVSAEVYGRVLSFCDVSNNKVKTAKATNPDVVVYWEIKTIGEKDDQILYQATDTPVVTLIQARKMQAEKASGNSVE
ncbi:MAG: hypothetical protein IKJ02_05280 [Tidjanibacter sp.]|nr:hypothetical protein [Tidjanibacter sp.]